METNTQIRDVLQPDRWVGDHGDNLYCYALVRVRRREVAEDLVQETLLAAMRQVGKFKGHSSERSWLRGILKNKVSDYFRKLGRETNFTDMEFFGCGESEQCDDLNQWINEYASPDWKPEGEEAMKRTEFWQSLQGCLDRLPARAAQVFMMREMDGVPSREICATLNISEANLWVMLHRARTALKRHLELYYFMGEGNGRTA